MRNIEPIVGAHLSIAKGFYAAYREAKELLKGSALQIFTKNPRGGISKPLEEHDVQQCQTFQQENHFFMVAHCSYLLNFAKSHVSDPWPNDSLIEDIHRVDVLGGQAVVLHIGKKLEMSEGEAIQNIVENIHYVLNKTSDKKIMILLENTAGQGTEIGYRFDELGKILQAINHPRVHVCMDTCHAFGAGYDLRDQTALDQAMKEFDTHIGVQHLKMFHLNDTKKTLGSRVDRHEDIGLGNIGLEGILSVVRFAVEHSLPCILETPGEHSSYAEQIQLIRDSL